jgi:predicted outer membrane protein
MKRGVSYVMAAALLLATVAFAGAQQPGTSPDGEQAAHMAMCRQMMSQHGMMGGGMMGMGPMMGGDARQQAEMMAMRGEMMKAMGDIMTKYAQRMQPAK